MVSLRRSGLSAGGGAVRGSALLGHRVDAQDDHSDDHHSADGGQRVAGYLRALALLGAADAGSVGELQAEQQESVDDNDADTADQGGDHDLEDRGPVDDGISEDEHVGPLGRGGRRGVAGGSSLGFLFGGDTGAIQVGGGDRGAARDRPQGAGDHDRDRDDHETADLAVLAEDVGDLPRPGPDDPGGRNREDPGGDHLAEHAPVDRLLLADPGAGDAAGDDLGGRQRIAVVAGGEDHGARGRLGGEPLWGLDLGDPVAHRVDDPPAAG